MTAILEATTGYRSSKASQPPQASNPHFARTTSCNVDDPKLIFINGFELIINLFRFRNNNNNRN